VEVQPGLWWWEAVHPEWTAANSDWGPEVSSYAIDDGRRLVLIDPSTPPAEVAEVAEGRDVVIVLTNWWHQRDAPALAKQFDAQVFAPPPDEDRDMPMATQQFQAGERLPFGAEVFEGREPPLDVLLWIDSHRAVAIGDTLIDRGNGIEIVDSWLADGVTREQVIDGLRPLLDLPIDVVLPTHGAPTDRAALERALSA
jgi:glyoxylase-like metal-dependent hydrolase (beta-lactamase superfamily II)